jgi:uncharacterized protein involved in tolerance to divalent cations
VPQNLAITIKTNREHYAKLQQALKELGVEDIPERKGVVVKLCLHTFLNLAESILDKEIKVESKSTGDLAKQLTHKFNKEA